MFEERDRKRSGKRRTTCVNASGKDAGRREEFLSAALRLFAEKNYDSVTIKDIAANLGVATALLYYYFSSKTQLLRSAMARVVDKTLAAMLSVESEQPGDAARMIRAWLEIHAQETSDIRRFIKIALDFKSADEHDPEIESSIARFYAEERLILSRILQRGIAKRQFKPVDVERTVQFIATYLDGCMVRSVVARGFDTDSALDELRLCIFTDLGVRWQEKAGALQAR